MGPPPREPCAPAPGLVAVLLQRFGARAALLAEQQSRAGSCRGPGSQGGIPATSSAARRDFERDTVTAFLSGNSRTACDPESPARSGSVQIRPGTPDDADAVVRLVLLIDLHQSDEALQQVVAAVREMITHQATSMLPTGHLGPDGSLSHGYNHVLIAEHEGHPVGVIRCGPAHWMAKHAEIRRVPFLAGRLMRRISAIGELAVLPAFRGRGSPAPWSPVPSRTSGRPASAPCRCATSGT